MRGTIDRPAEHSRSAPPAPVTAVYSIHVGAVLGPRWTEWFAGSEIIPREDGSGIIVAEVRDQAMLFGLLLRIRDLGIPLLGIYPGCAWHPAASPPHGPTPNTGTPTTTDRGGGDV
jgi:hypothetical protein